MESIFKLFDPKNLSKIAVFSAVMDVGIDATSTRPIIDICLISSIILRNLQVLYENFFWALLTGFNEHDVSLVSPAENKKYGIITFSKCSSVDNKVFRKSY